MTYRAYFKLQFKLLSPLSIGDSFSEKTDKDIILDSRGLPVIPATSIAGVLRSLAGDNKDALFGCIAEYKYEDGKKVMKKPQKDSQLIFYDAALVTDSANEACDCVATRDCVALDEYKTARAGSKFDFQAVETDAVFVGYAEARDQDAKVELEKLLNNALSFGSKTTRGYGKVELSYQCIVFNPNVSGTNAQEVLKKWLDFDMFNWPDGDWVDVQPPINSNGITLKLQLKQQGGLSIRQYQTDISTNEQQSADYGPVSLRDGTPVIPGTSWAGMFKHHMEALLGKELPEAFGFVLTDEKEKEAKKREERTCQKAKIAFSESQIKNGKPKLLTRNMIDRFTNGTKDGALYTELTVYDGTTALEITLDKDIPPDVKRALCVTIMDLNNGYATVGGLTAVGRGLFKITQVNGEPFNGTFEEVLCCV